MVALFRTVTDPILSLSHMFLPKSAHVGGRRPPPPWDRSLPTGNPGSATVEYGRVYDKTVLMVG